MKKIRVLMVAGSMHIGGIENQLMHLARKADKDRFQIDFTSTMKDAACREEIENLGGHVWIIPDMDWRNPMKYCSAMLKVMREGQYDVVHSHELFHSGITLALAKRAGIPCRFAHAHNWCDDDGTGKRSMIRSVYNFVMRIMINHYSTVRIACSSWAGEFVYGKKTLSKESYYLVYNSVDTEKYLEQYNEIEGGEFTEDGWTNILNVARVTTVKNQMFLTEIATEFKKRGKQYRILCAGNGDELYINQILDRIKEEGIESYIQLLGPRNDIDSLMRKSSVFVLPSHYEGMPLVMIEAQASGLPCVSANTYSPEVDFELNNVTWLSLDESISVWADAIEHAVKRTRLDKIDVEEVIKKKRFDSKMFSEKVCMLYEQDYAIRSRRRTK